MIFTKLLFPPICLDRKRILRESILRYSAWKWIKSCVYVCNCVDACMHVNMCMQMSVETRGQPQLWFSDTICLVSFWFRHCFSLTWTLTCRVSLLARELPRAYCLLGLQVHASTTPSYFISKILLLFLVWECVHKCEHNAHRTWKTIKNLLSLELQMIVSLPVGVLETKFGSSTRVLVVYN